MGREEELQAFQKRVSCPLSYTMMNNEEYEAYMADRAKREEQLIQEFEGIGNNLE